MSTLIKTLPKTTTAPTAAHHVESYSKRQRYEFEIFDKSIKEIENLFKQDIHTFKRPRLITNATSSDNYDDHSPHQNHQNNNYTYQDSRQLDDYLKKDKRNDSYKSLFSINKQANQATQHPPQQIHQYHHHHHHHQSQAKPRHQDEYHQLREIYRKKQLQKMNSTTNNDHGKSIVHPSIIHHIRLETMKKIDYYVNDIFDEDAVGDVEEYNEDGLFLKNDRIIGNLINIIDSNR